MIQEYPSEARPLSWDGEPLDVRDAFARLDAYGRTYGQLALRLLLHAAVPQGFRADIINLLRINFVPEAGRDASIDADVLFSPLSEHSGAGYFRLDTEVRRHCLALLDAVYSPVPEARSRRVARFLLAYVEAAERRYALGPDPLLREYLDIQRWVAVAFLEPALTAARFAEALQREVDAGAATAHVRLNRLASALAIPLTNHAELIVYAQGLDALVSGGFDRGRDILERLGDRNIEIGGIRLTAPTQALSAFAATAPPPTETVVRERPTDIPDKSNEASDQVKPIISLFYSYSHKDKDLRLKLQDHLAALKWSGMIAEWNDRDIEAGKEWEREIDHHLSSADIILLLVSASFIASEYCWSIEIRKALERHERGDARVIPVILRPCQWQRTPFAKLQATPKNAKPVTQWADWDAAFDDVVSTISAVVCELQSRIADILFARGDLDEAEYTLRETIPVYERLGAVREVAVTKGKIADILAVRGDLDGALRIRQEEVIPVFERLGDVRSKALTMGKIADILFARGDLDEALRIRTEEELPAFERLGDVRSKALTMGKIADILFARGYLDEALRIRTEEELPAFERLGDVHQKAVTMGKIADVLFARGDLDEALRIRTEEEIPIYERLNDFRSKAVTLWKLSQIALAREDRKMAESLMAESYQISQDLGDAEGLAVVGEDFGKLLLDAGEQETGLAVLRRAEEAYRKLGRDAEADRIAEVIAANAAAGAEDEGAEGGPQ